VDAQRIFIAGVASGGTLVPTPALPAPPASPPLVHPLLRRVLALGRSLAAEGPDAAMRAIERGELREPAEQSL
jgi:hypothetical protein